MNRHERRRVKRDWDKVGCFEEFPNFIHLVHCLHQYSLKVGHNTLVSFQLDMFNRWLVHVFLVVDGFPRVLFASPICITSERWIVEHFEDEDFECFGKGIYDFEKESNIDVV